MTTIKDVHLPFRDALVPATFRGAPFFTEVYSRDNGRRIITHEFPKKDFPYSEDMGRRAMMFSVRAFCITHPFTMDGDKGLLYNVDYRVTRDALLEALEARGPGTLILPTMPEAKVVVTRYRLTEEDRQGGYCSFDIEFAEYGIPPQFLVPSQNASNVLNNAADVVREQARLGMTPGTISTPPGQAPTQSEPGTVAGPG